MRTSTLLLVCILNYYFCYSQSDTKAAGKPFSKHTLFFEFAGNSLWLGYVNYDRILINKEKWKFAGRAGFSFIPERDYPRFWFPFEFSFLVGKTKHFFEAGLGMTYLLEVGIIVGGDNLSSYYLLTRVGYRYQRPQGGFFLKVGFNTLTPLNRNEYYLRPYENITQRIAWPYGGLGIGYTFKQRKKINNLR